MRSRNTARSSVAGGKGAALALAGGLLIGLPDAAHAVAVASIGFIKLGYVSIERETEEITRPDGTVIKRSRWGLDPVGSEGITRIGVHLAFDPDLLVINDDPSSYGFFCEYSMSGFCPVSMSGMPSPDAQPANSGTWSFDINNTIGEAVFAADWSNDPIIPLGEHFFFGFETFSSTNLPVSAISQLLDSPNQYCLTTASTDEEDDRCGATVVPLPSALVLWSSGMAALSAFAIGRRKAEA